MKGGKAKSAKGKRAGVMQSGKKQGTSFQAASPSGAIKDVLNSSGNKL